MPRRAAPPRRSPLLGDQIAINGTSIVLDVVDYELALYTADAETTVTGFSSSSGGDSDPQFDTGDVHGSISFRAWALAGADEVLATMKLGASLGISARIGTRRFTADLLITGHRYRASKDQKNIGTATAGRLTDVIEETKA